MNAVRRTDELLAKRAQARAHVWFLPWRRHPRPEEDVSFEFQSTISGYPSENHDLEVCETCTCHVWKELGHPRPEEDVRFEFQSTISGYPSENHDSEIPFSHTSGRYLFQIQIRNWSENCMAKTARRKLHSERNNSNKASPRAACCRTCGGLEWAWDDGYGSCESIGDCHSRLSHAGTSQGGQNSGNGSTLALAVAACPVGDAGGDWDGIQAVHSTPGSPLVTGDRDSMLSNDSLELYGCLHTCSCTGRIYAMAVQAAVDAVGRFN